MHIEENRQHKEDMHVLPVFKKLSCYETKKKRILTMHQTEESTRKTDKAK